MKQSTGKFIQNYMNYPVRLTVGIIGLFISMIAVMVTFPVYMITLIRDRMKL